MAAVMLLCAAALASATGRTTDGAADGHPPVRGAAPLYVSDYADNDVLRVPPAGRRGRRVPGSPG
ncbi:SMP-30/Gluconolactonase/LRE-like region domain-containing protein OS=Streptomyces cyaneofuscatus OX=66883 GN=G3I52_00010 PE=4 SV=1 [Streptomyces cyaneofuscatus]